MGDAIWWIRRDLRLGDNPALHAALSNARRVTPVFIFDPHILGTQHASSRRQAWMKAGLRRLDASLRERGGRLILRKGEPLEELSRLSAELSQGEPPCIYVVGDATPYAQRRDRQVAERLPLETVSTTAFLPPGNLVKSDGAPYQVFTSFAKAWRAHPAAVPVTLLPVPERISTPPDLASLSYDEADDSIDFDEFPPGEAEAQQRLRSFTEVAGAPIFDYAQRRDRLDLTGTSGLSPYLRFGMLSIRQAVTAAMLAYRRSSSPAAQAGAVAWLNELIWRDFYLHILHHRPEVLRSNYQDRTIHWQNEERLFEAWTRGQTGFPVIDAAMRQLMHSGWMHNRARMLVASFLTKNLLIDWRWGAGWFMEQLLDGDPASNSGGWQWSASTGVDAAPYFRIFNPTLQGKKHDPLGGYIKRWVPELRDVPGAYIHEPQKMPGLLQYELNCVIGRHYPQPIIDLSWSRARALAAFKGSPPNQR